MASVFTYDPDPPRVSSPWTPLSESGKDEGALGTQLRRPAQEPQPGLLSEYGVIKLQAEPQEGPTEYKLHLLLRPRRVFKSMSTAGTSRHARLNMPSTASLTPSSQAREQTRQQRL